MNNLSESNVLVVDDTEVNVDILVNALANDYEVIVAMSGEEALEVMAEEVPDLVLLDIVMPGLDGYEICRLMKKSERLAKVPVIFLTSLSEVENKTKGFELGAVDYITKPFETLEVKARVKTHLSLLRATRELENQKTNLEQKVSERTWELALTRDVTIHSLASLAETRDNETGGHIRRTQNYIKTLAEYLKKDEKFNGQLNDDTIEILYKSAPLHDIGKVGVPDRILLKPGPLNAEENRVMKKHTLYGKLAIQRAVEGFGNAKPATFLDYAQEIAYTHHEKWDGSGSPRGLKGEQIPLAGRLMALADVYDALISKRPYKPAFSHQKAVELITKGDNRTKPGHFDPDILNAFVNLEEKFRQIALDNADHEEERQALNHSNYSPCR